MTREEMVGLADASKEQYFLTNPDKLRQLVDAADIRPSDRVVELGAGVGTVARALPSVASLTLVEMDGRLVVALRRNVPNATIICADGVALIQDGALPCDVLLCNLPTDVTNSLIPTLPGLNFRTAVLSVGSLCELDRARGTLSYSIITTITDDDFTPPQPGRSTLVRVERVKG